HAVLGVAGRCRQPAIAPAPCTSQPPDIAVSPRLAHATQSFLAQKDTLGLLKEKLYLNQRQVRSALEILGDANVLPERLAAKLADIAGKYKDLKTAAAIRRWRG
ncbi:MAG: hypothetical protein ACREC0_00580, partial [Methylocella sp.]